jgi:thioredoxin 1
MDSSFAVRLKSGGRRTEETVAVVASITTADFEAEVLQSPTVVLVDFWAPWCAPCRAVAPVVESVASQFAGRLKALKLNVDEEPAIASKFGILSIPTLALFYEGKEVDRIVGYVPEPELKKRVEQFTAQQA